MTRIVQKYGGTSVGSIEKIKLVAKKIISAKQNGIDLVIVVSAMGKTTDKLIEMAKEISPNPSKREMDALVSTGEQQSIALLCMALNEYGYESISLTGFQAGIKTKGMHTKNKILDIDIAKIEKHLETGKIVVVAGFQGINENSDITTLGRGGSDTTAVALAAKLKCPCEIYTDVDGIYTIDPRLFSKAKKLEQISYIEMMELASLGAGVVETRAVQLGKKFNVPIYVALSSKNISGTHIKENDKVEQRGVTGLTVNKDILMITINQVPYRPQNISKIFEKLANHHVNIDMISQTAPYDGMTNVSFTCSKNDIFVIEEIVKELKHDIAELEIEKDENVIKISLVGIGMRNQSGIAAKIFKVFSDNEIEFKQVTTSEISISYTINKNDMLTAINKLAEELDL